MKGFFFVIKKMKYSFDLVSNQDMNDRLIASRKMNSNLQGIIQSHYIFKIYLIMFSKY